MRIFRSNIPFQAVVLLLTLGLGALAILGLQPKLESFQPTGIAAQAAGGGFRVEQVDTVGTGFEAGDVVLVVFGSVPTTVAELDTLLRSRSTGEVLVQRGGELLPVDYRRPAPRLDFAFLVLLAVGLAYLLIGLYTGFRGRDRSTRLFFAWAFASATFYLLSPALPPTSWADQAVFAADQAARSLLPALTLHLFLVMPTVLLPAAWHRRIVPLLYAVPGTLLVWHTDQAFFGGRLSGPATAAQLAIVDQLELIVVAASAFAAAGLLWVRIATRPSWESRRRVQWMILGLGAGYAPFVLFYLLPRSLGVEPPTWSVLLGVTPLALVPLAFAWALLKYRLLDLGPMLRDAIAYSSAAITGVVGYQLAQVAIRSSFDGDAQQLTRNLLTFGAGLAIAGVLVPTKNFIADGLETVRLGQRAAARRVLRHLGEELMHERDNDRLAQLLRAHLEEALWAPAAIYTTRVGARLVRRAGDGAAPESLPLDALDAELWSHPVLSISPLSLDADAPAARRQLYDAGFRYAFPLQIRGEPIGAVALGYKNADEPLSSEDLDLVRRVLDQAALAIENARLLDEVRDRLEQVSTLRSYSESILESSPAGIAVLDVEDRVRTANYNFASLCGRRRQDVIGLHVSDLLPVAPLPTAGSAPLDVGWCDVASGNEHHLQISVDLWRGDDPRDVASPGRVLVVQDVGERVGIEAELREKERLASLGLLAAGVAHEVNTPLTGISSYAQMLIDETPDDDPRRRMLEKVERQTFRASQIVNNLLDFARHRHDGMARVDLRQVVTDALSLLDERARRSGAVLDWRLSDEKYPVLGLEGELQQVVTNLVVNALDAMIDQQAERRVRVTVEQAGGRVLCAVSDSGPGIPNERLDTIFKPFFSSKIGRGGTGLGLAISHNIVRRHGGEIAVRNHEDARGCTFTVDLPAADAV